MAIMVAQAQAVAAQAKLAPLLASATEHASGTGALVSRLPSLAGMLGGTQHQAVNGLSAFPVLRSSLHVQAINVNTATIVATLGALRATAGTSAGQTAHAVSTLGKLASSLHVQSLNVNTAAVVATLPRLVGRVATTSTQAVHAKSALALWSVHRVTIAGVAHLNATLGPLASSLTVNTPASTLPANVWYYIQLPPRAFYAAAPARSFYALSNPNMTTTFSAKDPGDVIVFTLDATSELAEGETLSAITGIDVTLAWGTDPDPAAVVSNPQINTAPVTITKPNGQTVMVAAGQCVQGIGTGGLSTCAYHIAITCTRSITPQALVLKGILPVSAS